MAGKRHYGWYRPASPKAVAGGIKARSKRGYFSESWWGRRWEEIMSSYNIGARLARGKSYARQGQVVDVETSLDGIEARVQGTRSAPYRVRISFALWKEKEWLRVLDTIAAEARFVARLLGGEIPEELEGVLAAAGINLFPSSYQELITDCSCPDWSNPCKHIAAVAFVMAREFDRDPFLLFRFRGLEKEEFFPLIRAVRGEEEAEEFGKEQARPLAEIQEQALLAALGQSRSAPARQGPPDGFWQPGASPDAFSVRLDAPPVVAALIRRLGPPPFWRGNEDFVTFMQKLYPGISRAGLSWLNEKGYASGPRTKNDS